MNAQATTTMAAAHRPLGTRLVEKLMGRLRPLLMLLMLAAIFVCAGSATWRPGWIFLGTLLALLAVNLPLLALKNREIIRERFRTHEDSEPFDRVFGALYALGLLVLGAVAGLDAGRFGWAVLPAWAAWLGGALLLAGDLLCVWAMQTNRHVETTVRIQEDRGHRVIDTGPYRHIRHPMYAGFIPMSVGMTLILGSAWALVPAAFLCGLVVWRLLHEELTLATKLPGYAEYMTLTPWRLLPKVW